MNNRIVQLERMGLNSTRLDRLLGHADVRPACAADAQAGVVLHDWQNANSPTHVFTAGDQIAGYVHLQPFSWEPEACGETADLHLYLSAAWRNTELGIHMLGYAATLADQSAYLNLVYWAVENHSASRRFARAAQCNEWGRFPKLLLMAEQRIDISAFGTRLDDFFATPWGRRIRRRQAAAQRHDENIATGSYPPAPGSTP